MTASETVTSFPVRASRAVVERSHADICDSRGPATLGRLRKCARRTHLAPRLDLETLCARRGDAAEDGEFWGVALIQAAARDRPLIFHGRQDARASGSECWLAALLDAVRGGDADSARFICERHLDLRVRRLALCFAQRMVEAMSREEERRAA